MVAEEVRKLAERTTNATSEISSNVHDFQLKTQEASKSMDDALQNVEIGRNATEKVEKALSEIQDSSEMTQGLIREIALASDEQSIQAQQILKDVEVISEVSKQDDMGSGQLAKTADRLDNQAETLRNMVNQFTL